MFSIFSPIPALSASQRLPALLLAGFLFSGLMAFLLVAPLPQNPEYHDLADERKIWGIPHFGDVVSNGALLLAGAAGLASLGWRSQGRREGGKRIAAGQELRLWALLFVAVCLTGIGSAYYHWAPDTPRLFWDRLPLGLISASLPAVLIAERGILTVSGARLLVIWLLLAPAVTLSWILGEMYGEGDLRLYGLMQLYSIAATLALLIWTAPRYTAGRFYGYALGLYLLARLFELYDRPVFALGGIVSGHTLKHLAAALAIFLLTRMLKSRSSIPI